MEPDRGNSSGRVFKDEFGKRAADLQVMIDHMKIRADLVKKIGNEEIIPEQARDMAIMALSNELKENLSFFSIISSILFISACRGYIVWISKQAVHFSATGLYRQTAASCISMSNPSRSLSRSPPGISSRYSGPPISRTPILSNCIIKMKRLTTTGLLVKYPGDASSG